jgi:hypothetical protein
VDASILHKPNRFDRVDRVKEAVGEPVLPGDDHFWILGEMLVYEVDSVSRDIPEGFTTDGASVPTWGEFLTRWRPWDEPQRWGGIVHDWLYCQRGVDRKFCDLAFRFILRSEGASRFEQTVMYWAVRVGGRGAYRRDQESGPQIYRRKD